MKVKKLDIPDVLLIEPEIFEDSRGFFLESFNLIKFQKEITVLPRKMYNPKNLMLFYTGITRKSENILSKMKLSKKILNMNKNQF